MKTNTLPITTNVPPRRPGQHHVLQLSAPPMSQVRVAFVGLGSRGLTAVTRWCHLADTRIVALCDVSTQAVSKALDIIKHNNKPIPKTYQGTNAYTQLCQQKDIDLVYICTDWTNHVTIATDAMQQGKHVAIEVPAATTLDEIWQLIDMAELTQKHCIMLENAVYDEFETAILAMTYEGLLGEILHVEGGYLHRLGEKWERWRLEYNRTTKGDIYPTHGLGPVCRVLDIHRKDFLDYLVAMETVSFAGKETYEHIMGKPCHTFLNADQTSTMMRTKKGRTILLQHNVMTQRPYSRMFQVVGTAGYASKYPIHEISLSPEMALRLGLTTKDEHGILSTEDTDMLLKRYQTAYNKQILETAKRLDPRGGMSFFMDYRLVQCLLKGQPLDMDVYDLAEWCAVSELSRLSIENRSCPIAFPDFTRGDAPALYEAEKEHHTQTDTP